MKTAISVLAVLLILAVNGCAQSIDITFKWTAPGDDDTVGTCADYDLRYSTNPITDNNWEGCLSVAGLPTPEVCGTQQEYTAALNLTSGVIYHFRMKSFDEAGNASELSNEVSLYVPDVIPPSMVVDFSAVRE